MTAKARLLLVEDTPSILQLYHEVLARLDVVLIDAETGAGALTVLREAVPDVVLLDLELPDINGLEILRAIKARGLPSTVIVVTAHGSVKTAVEAMREGAYDFIVKPFAPDRLLITARNALARRHAAARRDLRDGSGAPGQAVARAAIGRFHQGRRRRDRTLRCALSVRHQPRPVGRGPGRPVARGPLLPSPRRALRDAAAARA